MTVDYIYNYAIELINKNQAGGLDTVKFSRLWNGESSSLFEDLLGRFQRNNNGKEGMQTGLIENETILQKLSPFTNIGTLLTVTAGLATKPARFKYRLALRSNNVDVIKINSDQFASVNNDVLGDAPSSTNSKFYFTEHLTGYKIYPSSTTSVELDYISYPVDIVYGFTRDADNRKVYDASTSTQPLWGDGECREITERMLKKIGISFKDSDFLNFGQSVINTGN